jgi:hypothetical protein
MPRPLRIEYEGACYHVMSRGDGHRHRYGREYAPSGISGEHTYVQS